MKDVIGYTYETKGVCSHRVVFDLVDGRVFNVEVTGGCDGNHIGVSRLVEGRTAEEVIGLLSGVSCGGRKGNSCPNQVAEAIKSYLKEANADEAC